jgi:hypothetical protein
MDTNIRYRLSHGLLMADTLQVVAWKEPCRCGTPDYDRNPIDQDPEPVYAGTTLHVPYPPTFALQWPVESRLQ